MWAGHSARRASTGFTRVAFLAGSQQASAAAIARSAAVAPSASGVIREMPPRNPLRRQRFGGHGMKDTKEMLRLRFCRSPGREDRDSGRAGVEESRSSRSRLRSIALPPRCGSLPSRRLSQPRLGQRGPPRNRLQAGSYLRTAAAVSASPREFIIASTGSMPTESRIRSGCGPSRSSSARDFGSDTRS